MDGEYVGAAFSAIRKGGTVVVTGAAPHTKNGVPIGLLELTMYQKRIQGAVYGMMSPNAAVPRLLGLWQAGELRLEEMITRSYGLDDINQGYADMHAGLNMRGLLSFEKAPTSTSSTPAIDAVPALR
jgi:Zn-dependent alcohol dehydrogenase